MATKFAGIQNRCLRVVVGAYHATPIQSLEVEAHVPPIDFSLDSRVATFQNRLASSRVGQLIEKTCATIQARIKNRRGRKATRKITIREQRREWVEKRAEWIQNHSTRPTTQEKQKVLEAWKARWHAQEAQKEQRRAQDYWDQIKRPPDPAILQLHKNLQKAESTMLVQLRTGRTGLRHFLSKARVPGYESGECSCGTGPETPRHVLLHCPHEEERRTVLREALGGYLDLSRLLDTPRGAPVASK